MDLKTIALIVGANLLALAVGLQRLDTQGLIRLDTLVPYQLLGQPCGLARDDFFAIVSDRIVLPTGVISGAGMAVRHVTQKRAKLYNWQGMTYDCHPLHVACSSGRKWIDS